MTDVEMRRDEPVTTGQNKTKTNSITSNSDKPESKYHLEPGVKGVYCSFLLLLCGMIASIIAQRYAIDHIDSSSDWLVGCPAGYDDSCVGNSAVYRFSFALVIIFATQFLGSSIHVMFFDALWIVKLLTFIGIVIAFYYTRASVFDDRGYAWFARFAGFFYIILQQIILIDFAYTLNEKLLARAVADTDSKKWYALILFIAISMFVGSYVIIGIMFWQFSGCDSNDVVLSLTLILPFIATFIQVFGSEHGSILTSAIMTGYATYICYSAITLNPNSSCNPTISTSYQDISTAIGLAFTVLSLSWTAYTAIKKIPGAFSKGPAASNIQASSSQPAGDDAPSLRVIFQEVSVVFILISAYYCMVLTNWATLQSSSSSSISNPKYGDIALWLQAAAQWVAIIIYVWTLVAPKLFPDREF